MCGDEIGVVYFARAALDVLQTKAQNQGQNSECGDGQGEKADQESVVLPRIHCGSPLTQLRRLTIVVVRLFTATTVSLLFAFYLQKTLRVKRAVGLLVYFAGYASLCDSSSGRDRNADGREWGCGSEAVS